MAEAIASILGEETKNNDIKKTSLCNWWLISIDTLELTAAKPLEDRTGSDRSNGAKAREEQELGLFVGRWSDG